MNQRASQPARLDLRQQMPETAKWVEARRQEWGADHVNACIRRSLKGEPGFFYALEKGHVLGTPFAFPHPVAQDQNMAIQVGSVFAAFMAMPEHKGAA